MDTPLHHVIRPGLVHFMAFPLGMKGERGILETCHRILADDYVELIEIAQVKDPMVHTELKRLLVSAGVEAKYCTQPRLLTQRLDLNDADDAQRRLAIDEVKSAVDEAAKLGIREVALVSGANCPARERPAAMNRLEASLMELCSYASGHDCKLVLEVCDCDVDKRRLIGPASAALEIATRVRRSCLNFGLLVDLSHIPLLEETPAQALRPVPDHIAHAHIGNAYFKRRTDPAWGDQHPRFGYPGGANNIPQIGEFLRTLFEIGYLKIDGSRRGTVSFEIKPVSDENPAVMLAAAKRALNAAWARLTL